MKILIFEYITGGGMRREDIPAGLSVEGGLMREALVADLLDADPGLALLVMRDDRLRGGIEHERIQTVPVGGQREFAALWRDCVKEADAVWPIAPETGGILWQLSQDVDRAGRVLLGCPALAVRLAGSKLQTLRRLADHGLAVPPTVAWQGETSELPLDFPLVIKPDDGVGCDACHVFHNLDELKPFDFKPGYIAQLWVEGEAMSLSAVFAHGQGRLLSVNRQLVRRQGDGLHWSGCVVNALGDRAGFYQSLVQAIAQAMPELWGYAGVDWLLTQDGPVLLEVNPRLTTSYAGIRKATGANPAAWVLSLHGTGKLPDSLLNEGEAVEIDLGIAHEH